MLVRHVCVAPASFPVATFSSRFAAKPFRSCARTCSSSRIFFFTRGPLTPGKHQGATPHTNGRTVQKRTSRTPHSRTGTGRAVHQGTKRCTMLIASGGCTRGPSARARASSFRCLVDSDRPGTSVASLGKWTWKSIPQRLRVVG